MTTATMQPQRPWFKRRLRLTRRWLKRRLAPVEFWAMAALVLLLATSGRHDLSTLEQIQARGTLTVLTINGATTYYLGPQGEMGFEFELASAFAQQLGVALEVVVTLPAELEAALLAGRGDLIAAGLPMPTDDDGPMRFGPVYEEVSPMVVYRRGQARPRAVEDLHDGTMKLLSGRQYDSLLAMLDPTLEWQEVGEASIEDLFEAISNHELDYTVADSNIVALNGHFFPAVRAAFPLPSTLRLAWAVGPGEDRSLLDAIADFFADIEDDGRLQAMRGTHFQPPEHYEPVGTFTFMQRVQDRLPEFRPLFEQAALDAGLDWQLLAAVGYQESHWNANAVSPTGVRGVMMLTQRTAAQLGVDNRLDPAQSIDGGARYLRTLIERLPERIEEPDRLWLALAAYNIGLGHLEDARVLTQRQGGNPDLWADVREHLPLLTQERWHRQTRFGYARGHEAVNFVDNVRTFHEILLWMESRQHPLLTAY